MGNDVEPSAAPVMSASALRSGALWGAIYMVLAGLAFALVNLTTQYLTMKLGVGSLIVAFGQYLVALIFSLPWLMKVGVGAARTRQLGKHVVRVLFAVLGVQAWTAGLAYVPIWQAIALIMTSPFFVTLGAYLILKEKIGWHRMTATVLGFVGGMIILAPWSDGFSLHALLPVLAALFWAATSLMTKTLTGDEAPETVTIYLLLLMTPVNAVMLLGGPLVMPSIAALGLLVVSGLLVYLAQLLCARAYAVADAAYVQPFDHVKMAFNVLAGWLVFGFAPIGQFWLGAVLIVGASLYILHHETRQNAAV